ncbi:NUDIX domain-containing protein [Lysinibacillus capsici]|uniref:NUDIX domain-containing protein n=1 Tax=Lysinibacillus capsici TaxID=2115968 RepID=UPI0028EA4B49|nr:NUDIX domain-containing protein [Lysinibacillus capsici]MED4554514.1 NUDIX domain-containing protein [Lysinibacillus capsici]
MIRNSVKAIIIVDGKLLLTKNQDIEGYFYLCPGVGQEHGETFHRTLQRECLEEIGSSVHIGELLFIREYIGQNHEHAAFDADVHQVEYYFLCQVNTQTCQPTNPDSLQIGTQWIPIEKLHTYRLYPKALTQPLQKFIRGQQTTIYLGDVN